MKENKLGFRNWFTFIMIGLIGQFAWTIENMYLNRYLFHLTERADLEKIIVVPVFVAHGLHTKRDIPGLLGIESGFDDESVSGHHHHHHHDHDDHHHGHHHHHHHDHDDEPVEFDGEIGYCALEHLSSDNPLE